MTGYHYLQSGFKNIWLENGYQIVDTPYGRGVAIDEALELQDLIDAAMRAQPETLTLRHTANGWQVA